MEIKDLDYIGPWSEVKFEIIRKYAEEYATILNAQQYLRYVYIDAFAGTGMHFAKGTNSLVSGSPINALRIKPRFNNYCFIDIDSQIVRTLNELVLHEAKSLEIDQSIIKVEEADCNKFLIDEIFPTLEYRKYRRALCLLDPKGLHLDWDVVAMAGKLQTIDVIINFPTMDINRNALWKHPEKLSKAKRERMTRFWGDTSWERIAYEIHPDLFGHFSHYKKSNDVIARAYGKRLKRVAGFNFVAPPIAIKNSNEGTLYYLFLASHYQVAVEIGTYIFNQYRT